MKFLHFLLVVLALSTSIRADTKVLQNVNLADADSTSDAKISVNNANTPDEELVIEGSYTQNLYGSGLSTYKLATFYVADKNGYRAKYTLEPGTGLLIAKQLSAGSLKSLTG